MVTTLNVAKTLTQDIVVTIFPDGGSKYLSENFWRTTIYEGKVMSEKCIHYRGVVTREGINFSIFCD